MTKMKKIQEKAIKQGDNNDFFHIIYLFYILVPVL